MFFADISTQPTVKVPLEKRMRKPVKVDKPNIGNMRYITWTCMLLACIGASWFAYQYFLVPQPKYFTPDWHGAQWIKATDGDATTAYFHYGIGLQVVPDNAFVTIAASQVFRLYLNGSLIGSNSNDFSNYPRAYMYEITTSLLMTQTNVLAIRIDNLDGQIPLLRANITVIRGNIVTYFGTGTGWQATTQASLVYPQSTTILKALNPWTDQTFDASSWPPVMPVAGEPISPSLTVNPQLYEQPAATHWITGTNDRDTYFVRPISLPGNFATCWLRFASTGTTSIFINGNLVINWNFQSTRYKQTVINKATGKTSIKYKNELMLGVYNISPYLRPGTNTIAVYISLQPPNGIANNQVSTTSELTLDMLISDNQGHKNWLTSDSGWRVSNLVTRDWMVDPSAVSTWNSPINTGRPTGYSFVYLLYSNLLTSGQPASQVIPITLILEVILFSIVLVIGSWLLMSVVVMRHYFRSRRDALDAISLVYLPALALEGLLVVLSAEPMISKPFPYTRFWVLILVMLVGAGFLLLWFHAHSGTSDRIHKRMNTSRTQPLPTKARISVTTVSSSFLLQLRMHWTIIPVVLLTVPLVFYNPGYEYYWLDELVSYDVAQSIMRNGLPLLPSGFVYAKGEFYSYILALTMKIFGVHTDIPPLVAAVEYLLTLLLLYRVGCYFFDRRVALLATIMLALSPHELLWARQVRMYQQAQLFTLLTLYLFYRAVQDRSRGYLVYLAALSLIATYLSHEESFIIFPAILVCVLLISFAMRDARHHLPPVLYDKRWWFAATIILCVIGLQQAVVHITHPAVLGTDISMQPEIQFTTNNIQYYFNLFFSPTSNEPTNTTVISGIPRSILMSSVLAVFGCFWVRKSNDLRVKYIALSFVISLLTLMFTFTMQADRYFYPLFTLYYLMAAFALMKILRAIWAFAHTRNLREKSGESKLPVMNTGLFYSFFLRVMVMLTAIMTCLSVLIMPIIPFSSYNLFISRTLGFSYYHQFGDYSGTEQYISQHMQRGDIVISIIPDSIPLNYIGHSDYFFSINHDLFLFEHNGHIVDTYTGNIAILNQSDFNAVLASHDRIWLISADNYYQRDVLRRFNIPTDFHIVYDGINSIVYLRGG